MGEQRPAAQVADHVQPVGARDGEVVVDVDVAVLVRGHADAVQAEGVAVRRPADGHHDLVDHHRRSVGEGHGDRAAVHVPLAGVLRRGPPDPRGHLGDRLRLEQLGQRAVLQ